MSRAPEHELQAARYEQQIGRYEQQIERYEHQAVRHEHQAVRYEHQAVRSEHLPADSHTVVIRGASVVAGPSRRPLPRPEDPGLERQRAPREQSGGAFGPRTTARAVGSKDLALPCGRNDRAAGIGRAIASALGTIASAPGAIASALGTIASTFGVALLVAGCAAPILANAPAAHPSPPAMVAPPSPARDPQPIVFPRADGPHERLTEWWYDTGHLRDAAGHRYGFEFVIFRAERGDFPVSWASHLAITDESGGRFFYQQRSEIGPQVDRSPRGPDGQPTGFALRLTGADPSNPATAANPATASNPAWSMVGSGGHDRLSAELSPAEATTAGSPGGLGLDLALTTSRPPALHGGDGWIDFGPAGGSYYYSRTRMTATGSLDIGGRRIAVTGEAWFDHQWGDFIAVGAGGWDWFAVELADGTDLTLSLVRDRSGGHPLAYGTIVGPEGRTTHLDRTAFTVTTTRTWTSPGTGATYPAGWRISVPGERLTVGLVPTVADQELDTRATTGVVYWEGSQHVSAIRDGRPLGGEAYVELTGYAGAR